MRSGISIPPIDFSKLKFTPIFAVLFLSGILAYHQAIFFPFVHDDIVFIRQNPHIAALAQVSDFFKPGERIVSIANSYWRPALEAVYRGEYQLFGFNPHGYHFLNILLHILNSSLVFYCLHIIFKKSGMTRSGIAFAVALVFLLHPVQSETVACVSGISNLLYVFFCLLSFWLYLRSATGLALIVYALALLTKEQAIIFPFLVLLYEYCFGTDRDKNAVDRFSRLGRFFLVAILYFIVRKIIFGAALVPLLQYQQELFLRLLAIPRTLLMYFQILLWPQGLHYYRSIDILMPWQSSAVGLAIVAAGISALTFALKQITRPLLFALGWFFITLLPTLNIIPIVHEYSYIAAFEHFLYLPLAGFFLYIFLCLDLLFYKIFKSDYKKMGILAVGLLSLIYLGLTVRQNYYWRAEVPLFERVVKYENFGRIHFLLGRAYYFDQKYDAAIQELNTGIAIMQSYLDKIKDPSAKPFYLGFIKEMGFDLAHAYEAKGEWSRALEQYQKILSLPTGESAGIYNNIGNVYVQLNDLVQAKEHFEKAVHLDPRHLRALSNLAVCHIREGNLPEAEKRLREALAIDSQFPPARQNLEQLLLQKKNTP